MDILALVEDEALLALPFAARCGTRECETAVNLKGDPPPMTDNEGKVRNNPFAALKDLLNTTGPDNRGAAETKDFDSTQE